MSTFFPPADAKSAGEIASMINGTLGKHADPRSLIKAIAPLEDAGEGDLTFFDNVKYLDALEKTKATACICAEKYAAKVPETVATIISTEPYKAFAKAASYFHPTSLRPQPAIEAGSISHLAHVDSTAKIEEGATIESFAFVGANAEVGRGSLVASSARIGPGVKIGRDVSVSANVVIESAFVGDNVILHPGVKIGQDGFGFAMSASGHMKVPQIGRVIIQDDVEIGANTTIDRGATRDTIIGQGTKIDNQVQIGHNVVIGRHCVIVSQVGISGSTTLEDFVAIGGQSGVNGHVTIGMGAQIAAVSVVHGDVPPGARWGGVPARPVREWFKEQQMLKRMVKTSKTG